MPLIQSEVFDGAPFLGRTALQLAAFDLIAIDNNPQRIADIGTTWGSYGTPDEPSFAPKTTE